MTQLQKGSITQTLKHYAWTPAILKKFRHQSCVNIGEVNLYKNVLKEQEKKVRLSFLITRVTVFNSF